MERPNKIYAKQFVGHSPVQKIALNNDATPQLIDIDTFSMAPPRNNSFLKFIGNGDVLLLDDGVPSVIATD